MGRRVTGRPIAIVTGGGTGVGAASALWFAKNGCDILINYRSSEAEAEAVADRCRNIGADALTCRGDVADDNDCRRIVDTAVACWGRVDTLVNSAGTTLFRSMADLEALQASDFLEIQATNVVGPYQMVRAAQAHLQASRGSVVNVSSLAGQNGTGSSYAYAVSKGALNTLTIALARNLAPDIRVNAVLPSLIDSGWISRSLGADCFEQITKEFKADAPLGRITTPDELAETIGWLATRAPTVTGQLVVVDGGVALGKQPKVE